MGGVAEYWHLDLSDEENVKDVMVKVNDKFGKIDILINNAAILGINKYTREITV
jgi:NAD(P)-dependent dehydrogenase (short-subunit alcohol dehydrogenase family)